MTGPLVLIILDGWGISFESQYNVLRKTNLPTVEKMNKFYPLVTLQASGISVGLLWGEPGNSEVGHMTLGAGRINYQNLPRITLAIQNKTFFQNEAFIQAIDNAQKNNGALHLMGLLGEGSVHSYIDHLYALLELAKKHGMKKLFIHLFTDGRDSSPQSGINLVEKIEERLKFSGSGRIASLCGRNWAMDRNNNWDRIEKAYLMLTEGKGTPVKNFSNYFKESYAKGVYDEYLEPAVMMEKEKPLATIQDGDSVIFFNFREDRARQLTKAFSLPSFNSFPRSKKLKIKFVTMTEYEKDLPVLVAFPPKEIKNTLGEVLSLNHLRQLRVAETEKYAHVTYFFNGGKEEPFSGEDRILVPSPIVSSFDQAPEMSAAKITEKVLEALALEKYSFILINYANADMVGHTAKEDACVKAVITIDKNLSILIPEVLKKKGSLLITADHGNIEEIKNIQTGKPNTEHTTNPVPLWYITPENHRARERNPEEILKQESQVEGILSDVAPTILDILGIKKPQEMTGESLLPILEQIK